MAFKSEAQRKKFLEFVKKGTMKQADFDKWNSDTPTKNLPDRIGKKPVKSINDLRKIKIK